MEWLEEIVDRRRSQSPTYTKAEARIEAEGGGYEVEIVGDEDGSPLPSPMPAGDENGIDHV